MDTGPVLISVLMPAYNCEAYVRRAVDSVLSQTHTRWELLVADDRSADRTRKIIDGYADPRIKRFHNEKNLGYLQTWNKLAELAAGTYITFQDADDYGEPDRLALLADFLDRHPGTGAVGSNVSFVDTENKKTGESDFAPDGTTILASMPQTYHFTGSALMIRKTVYDDLGGYHPFFDRRGAEDHYWAYRIAEKYGIANLRETLYSYRFKPKSVSGNLADNPDKLFIEQILQKLITQRRETGTDWLQSGRRDDAEACLLEYSRGFRENPSEFYAALGRRRFYEGRRKMGLSLFARAIARAPFSLRLYKDFIYLLRKSI